MSDKLVTIAIPLFSIILFTVIHPIVSFNFDFGKSQSRIISACVSLLSVIGMLHFLGDNILFILLFYAALGIAILLVGALNFITKSKRNSKKWHKQPDFDDDIWENKKHKKHWNSNY